jgi:NAD+ diphosphatase
MSPSRPAGPRFVGEWRGWPAFAAELGEPLAALAGRALQVTT